MSNQRKFNPVWIALTVLVIASLACSLFTDESGVNVDQPATPEPTTEPVQSGGSGGLTASQRAKLISGTVQIEALFKDGSDYQIAWTGSGTIISPDGLILTNSHVASPAAMGYGEENPDALVIGLIEREDKPPVFSYFAEVRAVDGYLDLAVLQITSTLDGASVDPDQLNLPYVKLGDSDTVHVGDHLSIFGFPGIGGETITFTDGSVSGFTAEDQVGDRAWIKTDATIAGGNSGGLGADDLGRIMGVPTIASSGANANVTDCRVVQDTNGDGQLTNEDTCIPIGGFINALRPINLAKPLIKAAKDGVAYSSPYQVGGGEPVAGGTGSEQFGPIRWVTVDNEGNPVDEVSSFESGSEVIGANFEYTGMTDGQAWAERWYYNGEVTAEGQFSWEYGKQGNLTVYLYNQDNTPLADGTYTLEVYSGPEMTVLTQGDINVGGGGGGNVNPPISTNGVTIFGTVIDNDTNRAIKGALFIVLKPGVSFDKWKNADFPDNQIFTYATTDINGQFQLPDVLQRNTAYTVVIAADGYELRVFEDETFTNDDPDAFEVNVPLVKQ